MSHAEKERRWDLFEKWQRAKESGVRQKDFCRDEDIRLKELEKVLNWCSQQKRRDG